MAPEVVYSSGKDMLALGPTKFHQDIAGKVETALGDSFPRMGTRFKHVSLSADLVSLQPTDSHIANAQRELPTLTNQVMKSVAAISAKKHTVRKHILRDVTGSFRPGTITLVLGQSGSGKSALMKLLSGRFPLDKEINLEGEIEYDGVPREVLLKRLPQFVGYVTQTDTHLPTLTRDLERQLIHGSPEENGLAVKAARSVIHHFPDIVLRSLGLESCQNTIVGNAMYRGISGGEKRRTTTGEMEFGVKYVSLMDEISTGLDSAATFDIVAAQRSIGKTLNRTGRILYHGPTASAKDYFASLGLVCPSGKDIADFLCELATPDQSVYESVQSIPGRIAPPRTAHDNVTRRCMADVPEFQQSLLASLRTLLKREAILSKRNDAFMDLADAQVSMGVIFAASLFLGLGQDANLVVFYDARSVFYKQRTANFYRTAAYVLACSLIQIPLALAVSLIFGSLVYWLGGLVHEVGAFLLFEFFLTLTILVFAAMYFLIAVSQYRSSKLDVRVYKGVDYCSTYGHTMGEYSLGLFDVPSDKTWVVYGVVYLVATYAAIMTISYFVLEYHRYERPENVALPHDESVDEVPAEAAYNLLASPHASKPENELGIGDDDVVVNMKTSTHQIKIPPVVVAFKDLWHTVSVPGGRGQPAKNVDLLKGITGYALPGTMTALMGSTGAGKTTLMDVIAGRKTAGIIKGDILLNGFPATDLSIRRCTGYCEQTDVHSTASTFREALTFSAFLRQDATVPDSVKYDTVDECLELLGLDDVADHIIRASSMEKMKRLAIGVEMAAQPSVLFLDEPTSGLDARSAKLIMGGVRRVADSGRTVLCTIHQPSSDVFSLFDSLLLLKRGGETVYFGELGRGGSSIVRYFEAIPSVPRIEKGYNPATWMLEVIGAGGDSVTTDFVSVFNASSNKALLDAKLAESGLFQPSTELQPLNYAGKRAAGNATQLRFLLRRFFTTYWRTPSYNLTRLGISLLLGFIFGFVYLGAEYDTYQGINSGLGMVYLSTMFVALVSFMSGLPLVYEERVWFFLSFSLVEIPYVLAGALLFTVVYYPMVGLGGLAEAALYWVNLALLILFEAYLAQLAMFSSPTMELATILGVMINAFGLMLTGFNPPALQIPAGYKWIYDVCPHRYSFSVLVAIVFGDCSDAQLGEIALASADNTSALDLSSYPLGCRVVQNAPASVGEIPVKLYVDEVFGVKHERIGEYIGVFVAILLVFRALTALAMRFVNHQQR
ncbi:pleiotropic drug resistance protein ABC superfamily [Phytophthora sojae]|uniref:Pleiotropic drug resistance protein ABC superfamily n=1 Tax=Phytophthora sojae (strain P6497) TaxID=1094619 RepID=G4ZF87_PHYSP|nr:pleiotropic drug resistance protein ABC superfamily [Phytophthora sojae]EGZ16590.1 pleiotropic drug resistance protein ABC superfamily [Phytophthora sojae]|eukprot:XP_009525648.1 pleiotropic drug resistance protein ABC superfamily [Phytophthora sojae]